VDANELRAWLRLTLTPGVGNVSARKLLLAFGMPQRVFEQSPATLLQTVNTAQAQALGQTPDGLDALLERTLSWIARDEPDGIHRKVLSLGDAGYPEALLHLDDPPLVLYLLGRASFMPNTLSAQYKKGFCAPVIEEKSSTAVTIDSGRSLALIGSRNPSPQGLDNARQFALALAQSGVTVVSGLALGIDGAAHDGALRANTRPTMGATIAVVGTGLDRVYPRAHRELAHRIAQQGVLISEYPLGTPPLNANFPKRNRLIAGLAQGTLVVEAALQSGSLITARLTNEQGKDVFAIPGSIHAAQSRGCHALIKQGAKLVESVADILEELSWGDVPAAETAPKTPTTNPPEPDFAANADCALVTALGFDPVGLDALQARTGLDAPSLQAQLMVLELAGQVASLPGGLFQRQRV